jgi:hypothetical protein
VGSSRDQNPAAPRVALRQLLGTLAMTSISRAHASPAATRTTAVSASVPSEPEIRAIRREVDNGNGPSDPSGKVPAPVTAYANKMQKKEGKDIDVGTQQLTVGSKTYYVISADNEGNGSADIVDPKGKYITGYSYSESEGPNWEASPQEAKRENAAGAAASDLFKRSTLGTSKLAKFEIKVTDLPQKLQDQVKNNNVKAENFYKANLNGLPVIADYTLYQGADTKPSTQIGNVTLYSPQGDWLGSADILNKSKDRLFFGLNLGRPE